MTTQLPERLRALADEAPAALTVGDLWCVGRRRHRRRAAVAAAGAALVFAVAVLGVGDWRSRQPEVVAPTGVGVSPMAVPDPLYNPSPWTPSTRRPGRLVAVLAATRNHFPLGSATATAGVAAGSQTYRFLDLPGQSPDSTDVALSPDGRHVAYWIDGAPAGPALLGDRSIVGVAVLDVVSGAVERHVLPTPHGLSGGALAWVGSRCLAVTSDRFRSAEPTSYAGLPRVHLVTLGDDNGYATLAGRVRADIPVVSTTGYAAMTTVRTLRTWPLLDASYVDLRLSGPVRAAAYDASSGRVAAIGGSPDRSGSTSGELLVGRAAGGHVHLVAIPGRGRYLQALAWVDETHVTTTRQTTNGLVYDVVDVETGARRRLTSKPWYSFTLAGDALRQAQSVPGIEPPAPWSPRWVATGSLSLLALLGGVAVLIVRTRRVRR